MEIKLTATFGVAGATQSINMCNEAYHYMVSNECPEFSTKFIWSKLKKDQRLKKHLEEVAKHLRGKLVDYTVYPD